MMSITKIPRATHSINPIRVKGGGWHCTKVSPGCQNCYSETMNMRFGNKIPYDDRGVEFELDLSCFDSLPKGKRGTIRKTVFVQSMGDLFHDDVPDRFIKAVLGQFFFVPHHRYLILTKRIERAEKFFDTWRDSMGGLLLPNMKRIWLGVSVENPDNLWRIDELLQVPAAVRFVSFEPLLGSIDFKNIGKWKLKDATFIEDDKESYWETVDWVIVGGESGSNRRECKIEWVRNIVNQCKDAGVPIFIKQLHINGKLSKNMNEFPKDLQIQEFPS